MANLAEQLREEAKKARDKKYEEQALYSQQQQATHRAWIEKIFPEAYQEIIDLCKTAANFGRDDVPYETHTDLFLLEKLKLELETKEKFHVTIKYHEGSPTAFLYDLRESYYYLIISWKEGK